MTFFVVLLGWAESLSGWSQSLAVQIVAPWEHKPCQGQITGRFIANRTMAINPATLADLFTMSHCHIWLLLDPCD